MCGCYRWMEETIATVNRDGTGCGRGIGRTPGLQPLKRCRLRLSRLIETKFRSLAKYCCLYIRGNCYLYSAWIYIPRNSKRVDHGVDERVLSREYVGSMSNYTEKNTQERAHLWRIKNTLHYKKYSTFVYIIFTLVIFIQSNERMSQNFKAK